MRIYTDKPETISQLEDNIRILSTNIRYDPELFDEILDYECDGDLLLYKQRLFNIFDELRREYEKE